MGLDVKIAVIGTDHFPPDLSTVDDYSETTGDQFRWFDIALALGNFYSGRADLYPSPIDGGFAIHGVMRYYGPGYERGQWPTIAGVLTAVQHMYPECEIRYGSDADDIDGMKAVTPDFMAQMWRYWLSDAGHEYRRPRGS